MNHYSTFWYFRFIKKISDFCLDKGAIIIAYEKIKKDIKEIISAFSEINDMAYCQYKPIAEDICSRIISENQLNHIMDRMMDFCADNRMLELFKKVCRKYLDIYPETIVFQINQYKEMYEEDE